jgi:hypothetical protein
MFMIESDFRNCHMVHTFRESGSVQRKPGKPLPKVRTEENIETVQSQMEDAPQLSLRQLSQQTELSVSTAERYRNNILDVFINQLNDDELAQGYFQQDGATARETHVFVAIFFTIG